MYVDKQKLIEWLAVEIALSEKADRWTLGHVRHEVRSGRLDTPDPLVERDAEMENLKDLISGRKGIEELYKLQQLVQEQAREIQRIKEIHDYVVGEHRRIYGVACAKTAEIERLRSRADRQQQEVRHFRVAANGVIDLMADDTSTRAGAINKLMSEALSHQTEQPDTEPLEMSHNDKYQLDCLIAKFGADYVYEYVCAVAAQSAPKGEQTDTTTDGGAIKTCINGCEEDSLEHSSFCYDCYVRIRMF